LLFRFAEFSQIQAKGVLAVMNRTVKLYQSVKRGNNWGTEPVPNNQLKNLHDLPEGGGNYYLAFYEGTKRRMAPVGRFADAVKQKLMRKRGELEMGMEPPAPDPEPKAESCIEAEIKKFLEQQEAFVGESGYGTAPKTIKVYRTRLGFYLRFCAEKKITNVRVGDYDHLMEYVGWLRTQTKSNGKGIGDRYVHNIFSTLYTFALSAYDIVTPKKVMAKLGYSKKVVKAHTDRELQMLWAAMTPDEELVYKFFLWSLARNKEVGHTEVGDLNFTDNTVHIGPKRHRKFRLKSKRNRRGNVGDRYVPLHPNLMAKLKEYVEREGLVDGDLLFPNTKSEVEDHYYRHLQQIAKRAKLPFHVEPHKLRKTGATLHYNNGKGVPLGTISQWLGHTSLQQTEEYLDIKATAASQDHIQQMVAGGLMAAHV
jgi:integrase